MTADENQRVPPELATEPSVIAFLKVRFGASVIETSSRGGEPTAVVHGDALQPVCAALRDEPSLGMNMLSSITAVDWPERLPRFDVVYHLLSIEHGHTLRLKVRAGDDDTPEPAVPTVSTVWPAANWYEREVWDLFGIRFTGHPNLRRIEMPEDWVGHPLRKDYPLTGFTLPEPGWGGQVPSPAADIAKTGRVPLRVVQPGETPARNRAGGS